ncbi:unnamed protein product, partial [Mesorhabditis spiculigera]
MPLLGRQLIQPKALPPAKMTMDGAFPVFEPKKPSKSFISKLLKFCHKQNLVREKATACSLEAKRARARKQRTSLSSTISHIEPMPTIVEEDEDTFIAVC